MRIFRLTELTELTENICVNPRSQVKGERLIPPAVQEEIRQYFREAGWNEDIKFDGYVEDYEW